MDQKKEIIKVRVMVSARHIHLTRNTVDILFGKDHVIEPDGPGGRQFLSTTRATVIGPKSSLEKVAVMGPCRDFNQVELSMTDARTLGIPAALRMSGDIEGTPGIIILGTVGEVALDKGAIVAKRHIHMNPELASAHGIIEGDSVCLRIDSDGRSLTFDDTIVCLNGPPNSDPGSHIDTDEANAAGVDKGAIGYIKGIHG